MFDGDPGATLCIPLRQHLIIFDLTKSQAHAAYCLEEMAEG